jgi:hypothetical protein
MNLVYATELTSRQWKVLEPLLPAAKSTGRPRTVSLMLVNSEKERFPRLTEFGWTGAFQGKILCVGSWRLFGGFWKRF